MRQNYLVPSTQNQLLEMVDVNNDRMIAIEKDLENAETNSLGYGIKLKLAFFKKISHYNGGFVILSIRSVKDNKKSIEQLKQDRGRSKYNIITFLPKVLFDQFKYFFNLFFLLITLSQFYDKLKVGFLFSYVAPLVFVLTLTLLKEAYDDFNRYLRDREANSQLYKRNGKLTKSMDLKVGEIIEIQANQRVPADCILLETEDKSGVVFIRTDQLDGETDWKLRQATKQSSGILIVEPPKLDIYDFKGVLRGDDNREPLNLENTLWANTYIAAGKVSAVIIYTGRECRSSLNSRDPRMKMGKLDRELNFLSKVLFLFMCSLAFMIVLASSNTLNREIQFFRFVLLLSSIIPISLRVNLDFSKLVFSFRINSDKDIKGAQARNSQIPEELGRIQYILSDKTGTLTQNSMTFKKIALESNMFTSQNIGAVQSILKRQFNTVPYPMHDIIQGGIKKRRDKNQVLRDLITSLCLCHNVTPIIQDGKRQFQASSPDEVALVEISEKMGVKLLSRTQEFMKIQTFSGQENYKILYEFPFTSERKRMGIILQLDGQEGYYFYLKGADQIIKNKVPEVQRGFLMDECEMLSREGLRTLVMTQKYLPKEEFILWAKEYDEARASMNEREKKISHVLEKLEQGMEFLGITGVEDLLQEDINTTIDQLRNAGINIWMLTGDKIETAQCIAISTGLKSPQQEMFVIKEAEELNLQNLLNQFGNKHNAVLVIDGQSLAIALGQFLQQFMNVSTRAPSVICCRCSPTQKAQVVEAIKAFTGSVTLSIGDGGNDVAMIQAADVGVGIIGKEGKQAALASDFSILKFKDISPLLLWHGRLAYKRSSVMAQFVMHRGLVISIIQTIFSLVFYYIAIPIYNGYLMLGYATVFTVLPVFSLIFDEDISKEKALEFAELYKTLQQGKEITTKTFLIWVWKSIYQGTVIMTLTFLFFENQFLSLVTVTFSALIVIELLNVMSELKQYKLITFISQLFSIGIYLICIFFLKDIINVSDINLRFCINVGVLVAFSWLPLHIAKKIIQAMDPSEADKIMDKITHR